MKQDSLYLSQKVRKLLDQRLELIYTNLIHGAVPDYHAFLKLRAQVHELKVFGEEVIALIQKTEGSNE